MRQQAGDRLRAWWLLFGIGIFIALPAVGDIVGGAGFGPEGALAVGGKTLEDITTASPPAARVLDFGVQTGGVMHAIYERITVAGPEIVGVRLTAAAYAHGLALALPEKVAMARPTGVERADAINIRIPIEGATTGVLAEGA